MTDIALDFKNKTILKNGSDLALTSLDGSETKQRIQIRLQTFQGEWFLDLDAGTPWYQQVLGRKTPKVIVDNLISEIIEDTEGVSQLEFFESSIINRQYSAKFIATDNNGNTIEGQV